MDRTSKIGRNSPCSCGSGRKYKKCCLNKEPTQTKKLQPSKSIRTPKYKAAHEAYLKLPEYSKRRYEELSNILKPYVDVTDEYGILACRVVNMLGNIKPKNIYDRVFRDLMADIFDSLYDSRHLLLENKLQRAFPLLRRAYESLSLLALICNDSSYANKWESGKKISNAEIRRELAKHPLGETKESTQELYKFYSLASHPNRDLVPYRFLGEGNEFVLGAIGKPNEVLITDYVIKHLSMWLWFGAVITFEHKELLGVKDPSYVDHYRAIAREAEETVAWLADNLTHLHEESKKTNYPPNVLPKT